VNQLLLGEGYYLEPIGFATRNKAESAVKIFYLDCIEINRLHIFFTFSLLA